MSKTEIVPLNDDEFAPYYKEYTEHVPEGTLEEILKSDLVELRKLFGVLNEEQALYRYESGKWSIKEILVHCMDTEVIFNSRALMFARGERQPLPGYDHEAYVRESRANEKSLKEIEESWNLMRKTTQNLFSGFADDALNRVGNANGNKMSVKSLIYIIPGHVLHHLGVIREKYRIKF